MNTLYVLSGASGMTGSELVRQILESEKESRIIGFDNFFASSIDTIKEYLDNPGFTFYEYDINNAVQMQAIEYQVISEKDSFDRDTTRFSIWFMWKMYPRSSLLCPLMESYRTTLRPNSAHSMTGNPATECCGKFNEYASSLPDRLVAAVTIIG